MVSYAYPNHLPMVADVSQSFALDNGAFTTWKSGKKFDIDGYESWVTQWHLHPGFSWYLIPDIIDGDESANDKLLYSWITKGIRNGVPIWHMHESFDRLRVLAGFFPMVALGSSGKYAYPGTPLWWKRMNKALSTITIEGKPITKLHGLRMLNPRIFTRIPLASADSTNASQNSGSFRLFGRYPHPLSAERANTIADIIEMHNSSPIWKIKSETKKQKGVFFEDDF